MLKWGRKSRSWSGGRCGNHGLTLLVLWIEVDVWPSWAVCQRRKKWKQDSWGVKGKAISIRKAEQDWPCWSCIWRCSSFVPGGHRSTGFCGCRYACRAKPLGFGKVDGGGIEVGLPLPKSWNWLGRCVWLIPVACCWIEGGADDDEEGGGVGWDWE